MVKHKLRVTSCKSNFTEIPRGSIKLNPNMVSIMRDFPIRVTTNLSTLLQKLCRWCRQPDMVEYELRVMSQSPQSLTFKITFDTINCLSDFKNTIYKLYQSSTFKTSIKWNQKSARFKNLCQFPWLALHYKPAELAKSWENFV